MQIFDFENIVVVLHLGRKFRFGNSALLFLFEPARNFCVRFGDRADLLAREVVLRRRLLTVFFLFEFIENAHCLPPLFGIERVAQAVADKVESEHRQDNAETGGDPSPGTRHNGIVACRYDRNHRSPGSERRFYAQAQIRKRRFIEDHTAERHGHGNNDLRKHVRDKMFKDPPCGRISHRLRRNHVFLLAQEQDLPAHEPRHTGP